MKLLQRQKLPSPWGERIAVKLLDLTLSQKFMYKHLIGQTEQKYESDEVWLLKKSWRHGNHLRRVVTEDRMWFTLMRRKLTICPIWSTLYNIDSLNVCTSCRLFSICQFLVPNSVVFVYFTISALYAIWQLNSCFICLKFFPITCPLDLLNVLFLSAQWCMYLNSFASYNMRLEVSFNWILYCLHCSCV